MDPKYDVDADTVRNLRALAETPGEVQFRKTVAHNFEVLALRLGKIDVRLARIEERQLTRITVAEIAKAEQAVTADRLSRLSAVVYGLCGAFGISFVGALVALLFSSLGHKAP